MTDRRRVSVLPPPDPRPCRNCGRPLGEHFASELCRCALESGYLQRAPSDATQADQSRPIGPGST